MNDDQPSTLHVRLATPHDVPAIRRFDEVPASTDRRKLRIDAWIKAGQCWVAVANDRVVGYGVLNHAFYERGFIELIYVARPARRLGVGSALVKHLTSVCLTPEIFTSTNRSNLPMQALLGRQGFVPSGTIENLDPEDVELVYFKRLTDFKD